MREIRWSVIAFAWLVVFSAWLEEGVSAHHRFGNRWVVLWLGPVLVATAFGFRRAAGRAAWIALPLAVYAGAWVVELYFGRTVHSPWWLTHGLVGAGLAAIVWVSRGVEPRLVKPAFLMLGVVAVLPWVSASRAGGFWRDCYRLRIGMELEAALEHMEGRFITQREPRKIPNSSPGQEDAAEVLVVFEHDERRADICMAYFQEDELVRFYLWPD